MSIYQRWRTNVLLVSFLLAAVGGAAPAVADGATRDLSGCTDPGVLFTVTISIDPPEGTVVCGLEEAPPAGWEVSDISDGGTWDAQTGEVKWGLFFAPSIPAFVTYDITPPVGASGRFCFSGIALFDAGERPIAGDGCVAVAVPTLSTWGLSTMALMLLAAATFVLVRRHPPEAWYRASRHA